MGSCALLDSEDAEGAVRRAKPERFNLFPFRAEKLSVIGFGTHDKALGMRPAAALAYGRDKLISVPGDLHLCPALGLKGVFADERIYAPCCTGCRKDGEKEHNGETAERRQRRTSSLTTDQVLRERSTNSVR